MLTQCISAAVFGIDAYPVEVEVDVHPGDVRPVVVGLPDAAVRESVDRVKTAMINSHYAWPYGKSVLINLAPADTRKEGPSFDLPIAVGIIRSSGQIESARVAQYALVGELALDGSTRRVRGALSIALECRNKNLRGIVVPWENRHEAAIVEGLEVIPVKTLSEAVGFLAGSMTIEPHRIDPATLFKSDGHYDVDYAEVKGQASVKRAMMVAAAGSHNVLMIGPPGSGKTLIARRLPTILPEMTPEEALETTRIYSSVGMLPPEKALLTTRPFRSPHHTASDASMIGGGSVPRPGEVSLAHNGVLFLDELPEFSRSTLEVLRQPMEDGEVSISRVHGRVTFPAAAMCVTSLNPCPCGYRTHPTKKCSCSHRQVQQYMSRISGPLVDRIDIQVEVPAVDYREMRSAADGESSASMREKVKRARDLQTERFRRAKGCHANAAMSPRQIRAYCALDADGEAFLERAMDELDLSARAYHKILKVARTIADLESAETIGAEHVSEAIQYRNLDRGVLGG